MPKLVALCQPLNFFFKKDLKCFWTESVESYLKSIKAEIFKLERTSFSVQHNSHIIKEGLRAAIEEQFPIA